MTNAVDINDFQFEIETMDTEGNEVVRVSLNGKAISILDIRHGIPDNPYIAEEFAAIYESFDELDESGCKTGENAIEQESRNFYNSQNEGAFI